VVVISAIVLGAVGGVLAYRVGGWLFPNAGDLGDITQGFFRLGFGFLGVVVGVALGIGLTWWRRS
jgi:hypothetical protein